MFSCRPEFSWTACIAAGVLLVAPLPGLADECDQLPPPSVTLKRLDEAITVDTSYGYKSLTVLGADLVRSGNHVLGLTRGKATVGIESKTISYRDRSKRWECASPQLMVTYGFSPMTVYVASEFAQGSCAYNEVFEHEQRHVKVYREHLIRIERDLAETLNRRFATGGPWRGAVGQANELLQREIADRWIPYIKREIARVETEQALIDTPEEYARVAKSCHGEVSRLAR